VVVRGVRDGKDRSYEYDQLLLHELVLPGISDKALFINASRGMEQVSSSLVKSFVAKGFDPSAFVPVWLKEALEQRLLGQHRIAVTGEIASGKTWVAKTLVETLPVPARFVSIDEIIRELYAAPFPAAAALRRKFADLFGPDILAAGGGDVDRARMASILFAPDCPAETRRLVDDWTGPLVDALFRRAVAGFRGVVVLEWAQLAEMGMGRWANNRAVVVESPDRAAFAAGRGVSAERLAEMAKLQWSADAKAAALEEAARRDRHGAVVRFVNRAGEGAARRRRVRLLADEVMAQFGIAPPPEWEVDMGRADPRPRALGAGQKEQ